MSGFGGFKFASAENFGRRQIPNSSMIDFVRPRMKIFDRRILTLSNWNKVRSCVALGETNFLKEGYISIALAS